MVKTHELQPSASRVITSLRDAGYDFNTAVADIVDNSIAAGASAIRVTAVMSDSGQIDMSISDNGCGMTPAEVMNAMKYGSDERGEEHSLGKFGLGLKTASTSQCRRVSVISRKTGSNQLFKLVLDIDHAQQTNRWEYLEESANSTDRQLMDRVASGHSGTVVRWERCDRVLPRKYDQPGGTNHKRAFRNKLNGLKFHLSAVFHRYLDPKDEHTLQKVKITVNNEEIKFWNPFCTQLESTWKVDTGDIEVKVDQWKSVTIHPNAYVVPRRDELRPAEELEVFPKLSSPDKLQGIYVYRENRLIHWGDWCGLFKKEFHYRLCRIELSFDSSLDELFNVDFKKSRIEIDSSISEDLMNKVVRNAREVANDRYRKGETRKHKEEASSVHAKANVDIDKQATAERRYRVRRLTNGKAEIKTDNGRKYIEEKPVIEYSGDSIVDNVIPVDNLPEGMLWQPRLVAGESSGYRTGVEVNVGHPFYQRAVASCRDNPNAMKVLDYLLWSLANAEFAAKDDVSDENFEELRRDVSRSLRTFAPNLD